jgi:hypothetical protein
MNSQGNGTSLFTIGYSDTSMPNPSTLTSSPRRTPRLSPSSSRRACMNWSWLSVQGKSACIYLSSRCSNSPWSSSAENRLYVTDIGWATPCIGFQWCLALPCLVYCTVVKSFGASGSPTPYHIHLTLFYLNKVYTCIYLSSMKLSDGGTWKDEGTCGLVWDECITKWQNRYNSTKVVLLWWWSIQKQGPNSCSS